jgi:hypothetical protein
MTDLNFSEELFELVEAKRRKSAGPFSFGERMRSAIRSARIVQAIEQSVVFDM